MQRTVDPKDHKMRRGKREIPESICDQKGCEFYGKPAAQGICYTRLNHAATDYVKLVLQQGEDLLKELKSLRYRNKQRTLAQWAKYLEGQLVCTWANNVSGLDQLVHLRAENARLRLKLGIKTRK